MNVLPKDFYEQPTLELARSLLGCELVKETDEGTASGYIVETEAYIGPVDRAAHSYNYKRTKRTEVMFGPSGYAYTYVMHTHCLVNVVSGEEGSPEAVLIRAVEPLEGINLMYERRGDKKEKDLTNGPGKLTKALGIIRSDYGRPYDNPPLYIREGFKPAHISQGKRIGIENSGDARDFPWRFWVTDNKFVSR
ncbi:putative 3-methyladenine DNA glycosylase [Halobacillus andaensis]|uniref:Putative 3-methyladenine DNA glycosylase n=1 Tax=Halobacillus andaensis TaxID=1176239 RepID=A0A917EUE4_HALAA|nr:DNA-3-methyladenine glycosylase [Halobacillus andaensis]MBP2003822.1 DNA-3-methyladenine glycosylase [Halobacillus andaensis]GGF13513.1 putative 3-methyladenine DNA glycosylase [Halobacillus andaensis]